MTVPQKPNGPTGPGTPLASSVTGEILGDLTTKRRRPEPTAIVIFGATGDLASRKLAPALYNIMLDNAVEIGRATSELQSP